MNPPPTPLVLFDLDHTLIRCDSFAGFLRELVLADWWRVFLTVLVGPVVVLVLPFPGARLFALSVLVWIATVGSSEISTQKKLEAYVSRRFASDALRCARAIEALHTHRASGARVLIVTGAARILAQRICAELGLKDVEVVGSSLKRWGGGWIADQHCYGKHKLVMLKAYGIEASWDYAYTDSAADLPLLLAAKRKFVINPRKGDLPRLSNALGAAFEVHFWE